MRSGCCVALLALCAGSAVAQLNLATEAGPLAKAERGVTREGEGARRQRLDAMERTPFDPATWAKLSDWQNGKALTGTDTTGKVVLIVTWTDYLPTGKKAVQTANRLAAKHKDDLIVVLAHSQQDWAGAQKPTTAAGTLLVAHDAKGEFRTALGADLDPDFYLIDRAGQVRYADIVAESVDAAVAMLTKESKDDAANINSRLSDEAGKLEKDVRRSRAINAQGTFVQIPELPFPQPTEKDYTDADWPRRPRDTARLDRDPNAQLPAKQITLPGTGWYPSKPETKGRAVLIYTWHPSFENSFKDMPQLDQWQRQFGRDLVIVGAMVSADSVGDKKLTDEEKSQPRLMERFEQITHSRQFEHYLVPSLDTNPWTAANDNSFGGGDQRIAIGAVCILSSDGYCRWWTHEEAQGSGLAALRQVIENDPGIRARRKVEEEWLKANKAGDKGGK